MKHLLKNSGFQSFLWTQFLGALNDNLYKTVVSLRAVQVAASSGLDYLSIAGAVFVLPFLLFSGYSGHLADKISKRRVMISVKVFEVGVMSLGLAVFFTDRMEWMMVVLFLMALHSTVFSPAKYGFVPEMVEEKDLSRANGLLEMTTFVAIVLGTSASAFLFAYWKSQPWNIGMVMVGVALLGLAVSFGMPRTKAQPTEDRFRWNPFAEVAIGTRQLLLDRPLWLTVVGISYFWLLGALFQLDLFFYGSEVLHAGEVQIGYLVTALAVGIGAGSLAAGKLSGDRVDLGFVPIGSAGIGLCCLALAWARHSYGWSIVALAALGVASGLFIVPLNAFLQQRSGSAEKGRIIATNNFYNTIGLMLAAGALWLFHDHLHVAPDKLIFWSGIATLLGTIYVVWLLPFHLVRLGLRLFINTLFRIRVEHRERVPLHGPALLVCNHVSFVDGILISAALDRSVRFMIWKPYFAQPAMAWVFRHIHAIPVGTDGPRDMVAAITKAREELKRGHIVCIFAEGSITRTGHLYPFKRGLEKIVHGTGAPILPMHLDGLWGSMFSYAGGKFFAAGPKLRQPMTIFFGAAMPPTGVTARDVFQAVTELSADAIALRKRADDTLGERFIHAARRNRNKLAMVDSSGAELSYGRALAASLLIADWARRHSQPGELVGVQVDPSVRGALANIGLTLAGRVAVNLPVEVEPSEIHTVLSSKQVQEVLDKATPLQKLWAAVRARFVPARALVAARDPDALAAVLFTNGPAGESAGEFKRVRLSHYNVISNIEALRQVFELTTADRIVGALPFHQSFGFTVTLWLPLIGGLGGIYLADPTDTKALGEFTRRYRGTLLPTTPALAERYTAACAREQFASLRFAVAGSGKLHESVAGAFEEAFGLPLLAGYGCTELGPVVAVNSKGYEAGRESQIASKPGTVGRPLPGLAVRIVDPETLEHVAPGTEGLLLARGPSRMLGYLGEPDFDGWFNTGELATFDDDGFLRIGDRVSSGSPNGPQSDALVSPNQG